MGQNLHTITGYDSANIFNGIYRGYVVWNDDPGVHGRVKVFVPGVYPDAFSSSPGRLPWARPISPSYGGGGKNSSSGMNSETGWCSVPHVESQVFVFFENGDINFPVYFGIAQSGEGWFSEHPNQHVFQTDNIRIRVDENTDDERSTTKFDSYTSKNTDVAKESIYRKYGSKASRSTGTVKDQKTKIDVEINAEGMQAVNLNIRGNVNLKIDGDWFVEHFGDYYEYRHGDKYIKQEGNTYIEQGGSYRKVQTGDWSYELNGDSTTRQNGDCLVHRHGNFHEQTDNDWTQIVNGTKRVDVGGAFATTVAKDCSLGVGENYVQKVLGNSTSSISGILSFDFKSSLNITVEENVEIHSKKGNIILQTDGQFELMDGKVLTAEGFRNLGAKGNVLIKSTFGNIGLVCERDKSIADFEQDTVVAAWNPSFIHKMGKDCTGIKRTGQKIELASNDAAGVAAVMADLAKLGIYDGLPVFLPSKMIAQNPNILGPENDADVSWLQDFRSEVSDWKSAGASKMWKIPGKMMGNINIETWCGDVTISAISNLGCGGNVKITAKENAGTLPGYDAGTIKMENSAEKKVFPDPRDLFLDSVFENRNTIFSHATTGSTGSVLGAAAGGAIAGVLGINPVFKGTSYKGFNEANALNIATFGNPSEMGEGHLEALTYVSNMADPELGCPRCITDFMLDLPGVADLVFASTDIQNLPAQPHEFGTLKYDPDKHESDDPEKDHVRRRNIER